MLISEITALVKCSSRIKRMQGSEFQIVKQPVFCPHCHEERLFTLRAIAEIPSVDVTAAAVGFAWPIVSMDRW
jgi:hypothetical protein